MKRLKQKQLGDFPKVIRMVQGTRLRPGRCGSRPRALVAAFDSDISPFIFGESPDQGQMPFVCQSLKFSSLILKGQE